MRSPFRRLPVLLFGLAAVAGTALATASWAASEAPAALASPVVGVAAPDFSLISSEGTPTSLASYKGRWVVLYFYPKDFTGGCTLQAHNFQRDIAKYDKAGAVILGVSVDDAETHKSFCTKEGLTFKLLADTEAKVSTEYGSVMSYGGKTLSARNTFLIDPEGNIAKVFMDVKPAAHSAEVLAALDSLQKSPKG